MKKNKTQTTTRAPKFTLELLARAISEQWATDPTTPGLVCAFLPYKEPSERFYVSVVRYDQHFGKGKRVIYSAHGSSFDAAARAVAKDLTRPTALSELTSALR